MPLAQRLDAEGAFSCAALGCFGEKVSPLLNRLFQQHNRLAELNLTKWELRMEGVEFDIVERPIHAIFHAWEEQQDHPLSKCTAYECIERDGFDHIGHCQASICGANEAMLRESWLGGEETEEKILIVLLVLGMLFVVLRIIIIIIRDSSCLSWVALLAKARHVLAVCRAALAKGFLPPTSKAFSKVEQLATRRRIHRALLGIRGTSNLMIPILVVNCLRILKVITNHDEYSETETKWKVPGFRREYLHDSEMIPLILLSSVCLFFVAWPRFVTTRSLDASNVFLSCMWVWKYAMLSERNYSYNVGWIQAVRIIQGIICGNAPLTMVLHALVTVSDVYIFALHEDKYDIGYAMSKISIFILASSLVWIVELSTLSEVKATSEATQVQYAKTLVSHLLDGVCDAVVQLDSSLCITDGSSKINQMLQRRPNSSENLNMLELVCNADRERFSNCMVSAASLAANGSSAPVHSLHLNFLDSMSISVSVQLFCTCLLDANNILYHIVGICEDKDNWQADSGKAQNPSRLTLMTVPEGMSVQTAIPQNIGIPDDNFSHSNSDSETASDQSDETNRLGNRANLNVLLAHSQCVREPSQTQGLGHINASSSRRVNQTNGEEVAMETTRRSGAAGSDTCVTVWFDLFCKDLKIIHCSRNCREILGIKLKNGTSLARWLIDPKSFKQAVVSNIGVDEARVGINKSEASLGRLAWRPLPTFSVEISIVGWHASDDDKDLACCLSLCNYKEEAVEEEGGSAQPSTGRASDMERDQDSDEASPSDNEYGEGGSSRSALIWFDLLGQDQQIIYCSSKSQKVLGFKFEPGMSLTRWLLDAEQFRHVVLRQVYESTMHMDSHQSKCRLDIALGRIMMRPPPIFSVEADLVGWYASQDGNDLPCCLTLRRLNEEPPLETNGSSLAFSLSL